MENMPNTRSNTILSGSPSIGINFGPVDIALRVRELVRQTCEAFEIQILRGVVSKDHIHLLVSAPPTMARVK